MTGLKSYFNLLEPTSCLSLFVDNPPVDFKVLTGPDGLPLFKTKFDLLTTLDSDLRIKIQKIPLYKHWSTLLNWCACFAGTTITEYAPLPQGLAPEQIIRNFCLASQDCSLGIIKDLPLDSPLLPQQDNDYAQQLVDAGLENGFFELSGQALAYVPMDFQDIDEYLSRLSGARRKDLRRKMKSARLLDIEVLPLGDEFLSSPHVLDDFYGMYMEVFRQSEIHFDLLGADFFKSLLSGQFAEGLAVIYRHKDEVIGFNICLTHDDCLIDKYIGFRYPQARQLNLYFVSWFYNLELALARGFKFYVAGWTDPQVKAALGATFTLTRHLVWIKNPALRYLVRPWRRLFEADKKVMDALC